MDNTRDKAGVSNSTSDKTAATFETLFGREFGHGKPFDLARLRAALARLGNPQDKLPPTIHVAGTNGKGSTIAFLRAIAEAAGLRVHAFTKPHLFKLNERFALAGAPASNEALIAAAAEIARVDAKLTQFDAQVAAALLLFSRTAADLVLLETGMGGRDDSTNVIAHPAVTVLTPIGLDHQEALGATLADIAAHKAGIIKANTPVVVGRQESDAARVIEVHAERVGAPLYRQGIEWDAYANAGHLVFQNDDRAVDLPLPTLIGAHQIDNAGLAIAACIAWGDERIGENAITRGLIAARWPGRLQALTRGALAQPILATGGEVWVDGGHNAHAAAALAQAMRALKAKREAPSIAIIGIRARKDSDAFIAALAGGVDHIIAVPLAESHVPPAHIVAQARALGIAATEAPSLAAAMQNAAQFPAPRVLICGSLLLAAEALSANA